jgi:hypothetical protein
LHFVCEVSASSHFKKSLDSRFRGNDENLAGMTKKGSRPAAPRT